MFCLGILFDLLTFPVSYPLKGLRFIAEQIQKQVDQEVFSPEKVEHELLELQMLHEMGDISDEEFNKKETELLDRLDELMLAKGVLQEIKEEEPEEPKEPKAHGLEVKDLNIEVTRKSKQVEGETPIPKVS